MISVIIPLMRVAPYDKMVKDCIKSLENQTANIEIIVSDHPKEKYIRKNFLYNQGIEKSKGDVIWFCDADFTLNDNDFLEKMFLELEDVLCPYIISIKKHLKVAEGAPMFRRSVADKFGKFDESLIGISWVTFPFIKWCIENTDFKCSKKFVLNHHRGHVKGKRHHPTGSKLKAIYRDVSHELSLM